jgi:hypothetical protein
MSSKKLNKDMNKLKDSFFKKRSRNVWLFYLIGFSFFAGVFRENPLADIVLVFFIISILLLVRD